MRFKHLVPCGAALLFLLSGNAWGFGPPAVVVTESDTILDEGGENILVTLENVTDTTSDWEVTTSASAGWVIDETPFVLSLGPTTTNTLQDSFEVRVFPVVPDCPPVGLVLDVRLVDKSGFHDTVRERLYFAEASHGLVPVNSEEYEARSALIDAGVSVVNGCTDTSEVLVGDSSNAGASAAASRSSCACSFCGRVVFWDSRGNRSNATGSRLSTCNTGNTTCTAGDASCCWRRVPHARAAIYKTLPSGKNESKWVGELDANGEFCVNVANEPVSGATYRLWVYSKHDVNHSGAKVWAYTNAGSTTATANFPVIASSSSSLDFGDEAVNLGGDTTSSVGDAFTAFVAADEAFEFLDLEGETRHHTGYNTYVKVYRDSSNYYSCSSGDIVHVSPTYIRELDFVHLLGFYYLKSVTGCSGGNPAYPTYLTGGYDPYTAEGNALRVGIPSLLVTLSRFDPDTASTTSIFSSLYPCRAYSYNNANYASDERNNWHALWEFVDTDTSNTSGSGADYVDLTVKDVMDGVLSLKNTSGSSGQNHTNAEQLLYQDYNSPVCFSSEYCGAGQVCIGYLCYESESNGGDPHGENIYDVVYRMATLAGGGFAYWTYGFTLNSSPCIGPADDSYPFQGGYRTD